jgi:hypothetical protein
VKTARLITAAAPALHKSVDTRRLTVTAALTHPWVGYEHLRWDRTHTDWVHADARNASLSPVVVGSAADEAGTYAVVHKAVAIDGRPETLPFGTTHFDPADRLSAQTFALVEDDALPAVSLELTLVKGQYRELGRSPLEPHRPAYEMAAWTCLGWVHCAEPVNPGALTIRKALTPATERAVRVAELGKVRSEACHPLLLKALRTRYAPALGKSNTVTGGFAPTLEKAMPDDAAMTAAYAPEEEAPEAEPTGGGSTPTVQALYQLSQSLTDLKGQVEEMLDGSEHVKGKKFATKLLADLDDTIADATEMAAKIEAELGAKSDAADDAEPAEEPEPDVEADDNEPDEDGVLKAIKRRPAVFKAIRRFTVAEIRKAATVDPPPAPVADDLVSQLEALQQSDPDAYARLARRAERKLRLA